ncbi:MAG: DUF3488 and transglutaminase-like domain-containing protein [Propionibacteriaceae bacterium]|nr:DUF3488 and transglutaminase-like domain-containing protein [Propionibacteriaceae bacterium]
MAPRKNKTRNMTRNGGIDAGVMLVLLLTGLAGLWPVFGEASFIRPALIGVGLGMVIAWFGAWRRWATWILATATVGGYFLFGTVAALWNRATMGFIPTITCLKAMVFGSVGVWKQFVTASTPVASFFPFMLVPFILGLLTAVTALSAAWRAAHPQIALIPIAVMTILVILLGTSTPFQPTVQGIILTAVSLSWIVWRNHLKAGSVSAQGTTVSLAGGSWLLKAAIPLGIAILTVSLVGPMLYNGPDRVVLRRELTPPLDLQPYASPLVSYRELVDTLSDTVLFTIDDWQRSYRLRLAVMDTFDGMVYNVGQASGVSRYDRVGPALISRTPTSEDDMIEITVSVEGYAGVWVPSLSQNRKVEFSGERAETLTESLYYNPLSDAMINTAGLGEGSSYTLKTEPLSGEPSATTPVTTVRMPEPSWVPEAVGGLAVEWAGSDGTTLDQIHGIVDRLHTTGYYSHGLEEEAASLPGHSSYRIAQLLARPTHMVGDDEQYAVAAALMLSKIGIPARVVMGFWADSDSVMDGSTWTVKGMDAHAWVEVPFDGLGWVAFFPTPDKNNQPEDETPKSRSKPKPQVLQPPPPLSSADEGSSQGDPDLDPDKNKDTNEKATDWGFIFTIAALVTVPLILIAGPIILIMWLKAARRSRRRAVPNLSQRVALGWQEILDQAADQGTVFPGSATRRETAAVLCDTFHVTAVTDLASMADQGTFALVPPTAEEAQAFWTVVGKVSHGLGASLTPVQRFRSKVSLTSLIRLRAPTVLVQEGS